MNRSHALGIISGNTPGPAAALQRAALGGLTPAYRAAVALRNSLFDWNLRPAADLGRPTISIGNLTTGGTGKTPMVMELAKRLIAIGRHPAVLLRGYQVGEDTGGAGDEVVELRQSLGQAVPVEPNPSRVAGAKNVLEKHPQTDLFLLDDAFQHRQVKRDWNVVLIDATCPFGFGRVLPRGLLREPIGNLRRADDVIVTRADRVSAKAIGDLDATITRLLGRPPLAHVRHQWNTLRVMDSRGEREQSVGSLGEMTVAGVCGIGNAEAFFAMLKSASGRVTACQRFDDHHHYSAAEVASLLAEAAADGAGAVVMTEKDWVKCKRLMDFQSLPLAIIHPVLCLGFLDGSEAFEEKLNGFS
jgi:tetraacyldisaccharide 4'-kinase